jgi:hypothetical protein
MESHLIVKQVHKKTNKQSRTFPPAREHESFEGVFHYASEKTH